MTHRLYTISFYIDEIDSIDADPIADDCTAVVAEVLRQKNVDTEVELHVKSRPLQVYTVEAGAGPAPWIRGPEPAGDWS